MEIFAYVFLLIITGLLTFSKGALTNKSGLLSFVVIMTYMVVVRYNGFDIDAKTYAESFELDLGFLLSNVYYYREPFFWLGAAWIKQNITHSAELTFLVFDGVCVILLLLSCKKYKQPAFFVFLFYTCFPSVMGYNNTYRQFIAACFMVYVLSLLWTGESFKKYLYAFFSLFSHNLAAIFFPLIIFLKRKKIMWFFLCLILILALSNSVLQSKSHGFRTGLSLGGVYALLIVIWVILLLQERATKPYGLFFAVSFVGLFFIFQDENIERFGMVYVQVMLAFMCILISRKYKPIPLARFILLLMMTSPVFLFSSAYQFLQ